MENKISASEIYAPAFSVKLVESGKAISKSEIAGIEIDEELGSPGMFKISFNESLDPNSQRFKWLDDESISPGKEILIYFGYASQNTREVFRGRINSLNPTFALGGVLTLSAVGYDLSHDLQQTQNEDINLNNVTYMGVVRELTEKNGFVLSVDKTEGLLIHNRIDRRVNEKDYYFLKRLAKEIRFEIFVRNKTLYVLNSQCHKAPKFSFELHNNIISFTPRMTVANVVGKVEVTGWKMKTREEISGIAEISELKSNYGPSDFEQILEKAKKANLTEKVEGKVVRSTEEAKEIALSELSKRNENFITGTLECVGNAALMPGMTVNVEKVGARFSGSYYVTKAIHKLGDNGYRTTLELRRCL
jgi:uncharacterized protein